MAPSGSWWPARGRPAPLASSASPGPQRTAPGPWACQAACSAPTPRPSRCTGTAPSGNDRRRHQPVSLLLSGSARVNTLAMANRTMQGWFEDPFRLHEARYFSAGRPTKLVRDGNVESYDEPPSDSREWASTAEGQGESEFGTVRALDDSAGWAPADASGQHPAWPPRPKGVMRSLRVTGAAMAVAIGVVAVHAAARTRQEVPEPGIHKISHVIVITQENRSFDSYFGTYPGADAMPAGVCRP